MITLTIDGRQVTADVGTSILNAALDAGIYIPHLCAHPKLAPLGNCKLCSVEVDGVEGIIQSCETEAADGMVIHTATEPVKHLRQLAMELMLASHPDDCTSCKAYLKCELQSLIQYLGVANARMHRFTKNNIGLASGPANPLIRREAERCVQCGRCVRACDELRGVGALEFRKQDGEIYVGIKSDRSLSDSDCRFCGACIAVCPTGAIQDMPGVFPDDAPQDQALIPCQYKCPAHTDIPTYVRLAKEGRYEAAHSVIREKLTFPHTLGLICTHKCEEVCKRSHLNESVDIREIKRFAVEQDSDQPWRELVKIAAPTGKKVAVIGAGPAGLTAAWHLARKGHDVTVLERESNSGGMLRYGIPKYRLPRTVVAKETAVIESIGVKIRTNSPVSSVAVLKKDYDAVVACVGAQSGNVPPLGDAQSASNVWPAVAFCKMAAKDELPDMGSSLTVIGGGNVAFDCARSAKLAGVETVRLLCLEPKGGMLADEEEIEAATAEGIDIFNSRTAIGCETKGGRVISIDFKIVTKFSFGPGGLELETEEGSEHRFETDSLVFATGQRIDLTEDFGLRLGRANSVVTGPASETDVEGVFAAGDCVTGTKAVVEAVAAGSKVASSVDRYLGGDGDITEHYWTPEEPQESIGTIEGFAELTRKEKITVPEDEREACSRCLQCDLRLLIRPEKFWTDDFYSKRA
ncbi:MAG: FAD-dependent oxidoreductase [Clostridiales Family XIII bacterium]|jgi:NADPH-dependent glutamate synthase beta subunit-like oxidoreductase/ferredoxin|nr:FAD-dependent oxidoreductase [Clostridiales Family XIII bacterium]